MDYSLGKDRHLQFGYISGLDCFLAFQNLDQPFVRSGKVLFILIQHAMILQGLQKRLVGVLVQQVGVIRRA